MRDVDTVLQWLIAHGAPESYSISSETLHYPGGAFVIDSLHMAHGSAQIKMSLPLVLAMPEVALVDIGRALSLAVQWEPYTEPSQLAPIPRPIGAPDPARPGYYFTAPGDVFPRGAEWEDTSGRYRKTWVFAFAFFAADRWQRIA